MLVYSNKITKFINEIKEIIKDVLSKELKLDVEKNRFYDKSRLNSYPISIVIFNDKKHLGYFDSEFYELGFHEDLMFSSRELLGNIIRHELAHYVIFINFGNIQSHGFEFKALCQRLGWGEEVYKSTHCINSLEDNVNIEESAIFRKVQKLMALSTSSNQNEAEQAIIKSQQLLLKHNIESKYVDNKDEDKIFLKRIMKQKKKDAKMSSIAKILETFFVNVIYKRSENFTYLDILGEKVNIEIAEYVADILQREFDQLWEKTKNQYIHLKGMVAKNSFFLGIAKGYCEKIQFLKKEYNSEINQALMVIEKKLVDAQAMVYKRLSTSRSRGFYCPTSLALGQQAGKQLNINPAIEKNSKNSNLYLS